MVIPVISMVGFSEKHVLKVEFLQTTISQENSNPNQNGSGGPGPKWGPQMSRMYIYTLNVGC